MNSSTVSEMTPADEPLASDIMLLAFAADPATRWTWPRSDVYLATMPRLVHAFGGKAFTCGGAHCVGDGAGAALWLPPGVEPDQDGLAEVMQSSLSPTQLESALALFQQMAAYHPHEPHWYLPLIGVDPAQQGKGFGDALMSYALERCDRDRAPAYLESSNPRNIPLYRRHGFEPLGEIRAASSPTIVPMLRRARR
ncbi:N-acetyltransferase [Bradyrhizobium sp. LHD-71]|uniref:GNAT family N-acetyltransferase n=1 Tax=Bradyrhizobium sp. LHD-71 TaxID=3072141 RepID=UPI00280FB45D|nr:N-acetyltransferase [Bradyrhizobium sp. LHD-71]MDQ8726613.1 N-acetyltransferase [Bradyrhizobium sp. LHD-71]